ncbi:MAG: META domain-containing protein [Bacteroidales bacterium]|nr:META domain-containing protein [Bacteroidales bacterium]
MRKLVLIIPLLLLLVSCSSHKKVQVEDQNAGQTKMDLLNNIWDLVAVDGEELDFSDETIYKPVLELLLKDSVAIGRTGCNNFQAKMVLDGDKISFPPFPMTQMFCPGYEGIFVNGIGATATYKVDRMNLYFYNKGGKEVLRFKKKD